MVRSYEMARRSSDPQRMRRSAWIFFASILLPSLGLAWLAIRSVRDQQVILEHQQVIISQNITDALAKSVQDRMDAIRGDFVKTTAGLLGESASPEVLAGDFNQRLRAAWPLAEIGFAVNLDGRIYSPQPAEDSHARTFRSENGRFLTNRENAEVYSSSLFNQNAMVVQNASAVLKSSLGWGGGPSGKTGSAVNGLTSTLDIAQTKLPPPVQIDDLKMADSVATKKDEAEKAGLKPAEEKPAPVAKPRGETLSDALAGELQRTVTESKSKRAAVASVPASGTGMGSDGSAAPANVPATPPATAAMPAPATTAPVAKPQADLEKEVPVAAAASAPADAVTATSTGSIAPAQTAAQAPDHSAMGGGESTRALPEPATFGQPVHLAPVAAPPPPPRADAGYSMQETDKDAAARITTKLEKIQRQVIPQQMLARDAAPLSNTVPADSDFRRVIGSDTSGELARFLDNKLRLLVWSHAVADAPIVFGAQLDQARLIDALKESLQLPEISIRSSYGTVDTNYCVAILDDTGHPVALSRPGFSGDWKHPFVATEIGEVLPHWEAALYQIDPRQISRAARTVQWTLGSIVLLLVAAILAGGSLIAADVRRQVRLAQQKTDFVSNVSHELKTPLTSIRMFADLLAEKRVPDEERQATYLRIIAAEASRLTRLINNVLDFARLERGAKDAAPGEHRHCDLVEALRDVIDTCGPHLEAAGITFRHEIEADSLPIRGDRDALAQIILNLVSNAEKYGGGDILVRARRHETAGGALGCIDVLDRGAGIPAREVRTIFEPFQRLDDSLASGIPGSGLGLTIARRMARAHGGDVAYTSRAGGGSCFTLTIPLASVA